MGMGYGANYSDVISQEDIIKICGDVATDFFNWFEDKPKGLLDHFATMVYKDYDDLGDFTEQDEFEHMHNMYKCLMEDFKQRSGLTLELEYHYKDDEGDRYDEVDGHYWSVYGVYQISPEYQKLKAKGIIIPRKFFVQFG